MMLVRIKSILLLTVLLVTVSCTKVDTEKKEINNETSEEVSSTNDQLEQLGVIGIWKLDARYVNNISGMSVPCCDYIEFQKDSIADDLVGNFRAYGTGYENIGVFKLMDSNTTIAFEYNSQIKSYGFGIAGNIITFNYTEDSSDVEEQWRKEQ